MSDTVYVLDQVGIRLVKEKTLISDTQLKRPEQVVGFVSDILREYDREVMCVICLNAKLRYSIGFAYPRRTKTLVKEFSHSMILSNSRLYSIFILPIYLNCCCLFSIALIVGAVLSSLNPFWAKKSSLKHSKSAKTEPFSVKFTEKLIIRSIQSSLIFCFTMSEPSEKSGARLQSLQAIAFS